MNDEEIKKKERKKRSKSIFMRFDFLTLSKVSETMRVLLHLDSEMLLVYGLSVFLLARLGVRSLYPMYRTVF